METKTDKIIDFIAVTTACLMLLAWSFAMFVVPFIVVK